jgi:hypothetical protein
LSGKSFEHPRIVGQFEGTKPDGIDLYFIVEAL